MDINKKRFRYEYNLEKLRVVTPKKRDFKMLITPRFVDHYVKNVYEDLTSSLILNFAREDMLFIDIGAHYGYYALLIGTKYPGCKIIAFEPVPENFKILKRNIALNHLKNAELHKIALSDVDGLRKFKIVEASDNCGFYDFPHPSVQTLKEIKVKTARLDHFLRKLPKAPIIIKIDTEGHEPHVLRGMKKLLRNSKDVKLIIEVNPKSLKRGGYTPEELFKKISQLGFDTHVIDNNKRMVHKLPQHSFKNWHDYLPDNNEIPYVTNALCVKNKKSLSVCFFSHSAELYGAERILLELVKELIEDYGVICTVVLPRSGPLKEKLEKAGAATCIIDYSWWYDQKILPDEQITELCINSASNLLYNLRQTLSIINPDIIITNTMSVPWGAIAASFLRKPHIWFVQEFGEADHGLKTFLPFNTTLEIIKNLSAIILTPSKAVKRMLFPNLTRKKALTVYHYINIPPTIIYQDKNKYFARKNSTKLIISATIQEGKGQKDAILAIKELVRKDKDVELIIMGYGNNQYADYLKGMVSREKLRERIKFIGFKENPYPIMKQADIGLVCSKKESFGCVTTEWMLLKKPVIGTNSGGTPEQVKEGFNGLLYEPGDYSQLADKIEYLMNQPDKARQFGENGYKFAKKTFTKDKFGGRIYKLLLGLKHKTAPKTSLSGLHLEGPSFLDAFLAAANNKDPKITDLITELGNSLKIRNSQIREKDSQIQEKDSQIQEKDSQIHNLEFQLQETQQSILMQLASRYHKIMEKLLPSDTRRRHYYELGLTSIRIILNEGWRSFFRKARYWLIYRPAVLKQPRDPIELTITAAEPKVSPKPIKGVPNPEKITSLDEIEELVFKPATNPLVSVIILTHNQWRYTYICLKSILENTAGNNYEIILADNCSTDLTSAMLKKVKGIKVIKNKENLGFVKGCNRAAAFANGKYILFLNNDTYVTKGWLTTMLEIIKKDDKIGLVGPNLIAPNGKLQENGWIIRPNGVAEPIGIGQNPDDYEYNYLKEVDCVTGACLLIKKEVFFQAGLFDEIYAPGCYEEFDLAFTVRKKGYKVVLQPKAKIVHFGKITWGISEADRLASKNRGKS